MMKGDNDMVKIVTKMIGQDMPPNSRLGKPGVKNMNRYCYISDTTLWNILILDIFIWENLRSSLKYKDL